GGGGRIQEHPGGRGREGAPAGPAAGGGRAEPAIVAAGPASGALRPPRDRLTVSSSHIVLTEPVPDVVEAIGWTGGEAISDGRTLLHYLRTTPDGRILFGWAGGRGGAGGRPGGGGGGGPRGGRGGGGGPAAAFSPRGGA